jgi:hypothetical protein
VTTSPDFAYNPYGSTGPTNDLFGLGDLASTLVTITPGSTGVPSSNLVKQADGSWGSQGSLKPTQMTANQYFSGFVESSQQKDKSAYIAAQKALQAAGLYGSNKPTYGSYTGADHDAMAKALQQYSDVAKTNPNVTLSGYLQGLGAAGVGGSYAPTPPPLQLTDSETLTQTLQQASQNALGRNLSSKELAHFVSAFHGKEQSAYDARNANKTSTNPEVSGEAMSFVDDNHQGEENQFREASYVDQLNKMLGVL